MHHPTEQKPEVDFLDLPGAQLNHLYLIVNAVEGVDAGAYVFHRDRGLIECLKRGSFRDQAGYLGLEQDLPADAAVDIFFLADLEPILQRFGTSARLYSPEAPGHPPAPIHPSKLRLFREFKSAGAVPQ